MWIPSENTMITERTESTSRIRRIAAGLLLAIVSATATAAGGSSPAAAIDRLPKLTDDLAAPVKVDWLVQPVPRGAGVYRTGSPDEIVLANGLISRTYRLSPDCATIALDNLMTGESILRGIKPEAVVEIDGARCNVGGLRGQPNHAYLDPAWLDKLTAEPDAFHFVGLEVGPVEKRFPWSRVRHHAPNVEWPPAGVHLRLDFRLTSPSPRLLDRVPEPSAGGRKELIAKSFHEHADGWSLHLSRIEMADTSAHEDDAVALRTPANTTAFLERPLQAGTRLVEATIDVGSDCSASWGPGIALIWPQRVIKFNLRPGETGKDGAPAFGVFDGAGERLMKSAPPGPDPKGIWALRLRLEDHAVYCEARPEGGEWTTCFTLPLDQPAGDPQSVRVGKLSRMGDDENFHTPGELVQIRLLRFAAYTGLDEEAKAARTDKLDQLKQIRVSVHYELYDGIPVLSKWITVHNPTKVTITLDRFTSELLAAVEYASDVGGRRPIPTPYLHIETDYAFGGGTARSACRRSVHWVADPEYLTQVNYRRTTPCLLEVRPTIGPSQDIAPGGTFESFRAFELVHDSTERERNGLALRRMYRTIAPWVTENPLMMHVRYADEKTVKEAIDQCADVGFEMVILTFGSGFNIEDEDPAYMARMREYADYARERGIEIGGYSLLASRRIKPDSDNALNPETGTIFGQTFGTAPALASGWGREYFLKLYRFFDETGFRLLEHDGSYPGDLDAMPRPPLQKGAADSRWVQWRIITDFYKWCRASGVYLNVPDYYYLSGSNKCGMGYRETNWSLPRPQQVIHTRQNIHDGTWEKTPSMGWMFVPLTQYHGGGAAATIEPLRDHLDHYELMLASNLALGVQACYRGPRLYDGEQTRALVRKWVGWFKEYRDILESDLIHGRRADGRDIDWMLHVNPFLPRKGMLIVFNPLDEPITGRSLRVPLYYTGLTDVASIREQEGPARRCELDRQYRVDLTIDLPPKGITWFVIE